MHFELKQYISETLSRSDYRSCLGICNVEVTDCAEKLGGELTSDIAFLIAEHVTKQSGQEIFPPDVSRNLVSLLSQSENNIARYFNISVGGPGHINATLKNVFVDEYLKKLARLGKSVLFQELSFVVSEDFLVTSRQPKPIVFNLKHLIEKRGNKQRHDIELLIAARNGLAELSQIDLMMILGLVADSELDVTVYLNNLAGKENVPWYLFKFVQDSKNLAQELEVSSATRPESRTESSFYSDMFSVRVNDFLRQLLRIRAAYRSSLKQQRPDILLRTLLEMIGKFYLFYNHPSERALICAELDSDSAEELALLLRISAETVETSLQLFSRT